MQKLVFRVRGNEVTRVEAFSDVVFGFALTLIVVSVEVPPSYAELMNLMRGFWAFAICFAILTWIWYVHHTFFVRYALTDETTIVLNAVLLFLVLFYTYPLKFTFAMLMEETRRGDDWPMVIYGLGFAGIFAVFLAMYAHAWRKRDELELNDVEQYDTKTNMMMYAAYVVLGLVSALLGAFPDGPAQMISGLMYWLLGPISAGIGWSRGARRQRLFAEAPRESSDHGQVMASQ